MKVICINAGALNNITGITSAPQLKEGETYTVIEETVSNFGSLGYHLSEVKATKKYGFLRKRFIPLSEIDETELVNEKQLINQ